MEIFIIIEDFYCIYILFFPQDKQSHLLITSIIPFASQNLKYFIQTNYPISTKFQMIQNQVSHQTNNAPITNQSSLQQKKQIQPQIILQHKTLQARPKWINQNVLTQQLQSQQENKTQNKYKKQEKQIKKKLVNATYRSHFVKSIHHTNQLILVYLMYKQQKLSLFLNKGISFQQLLKKMYKQIYIYQKQTYSISNAILKNLLYKITGFQSIDNDLFYDYQLKYKRGTLNKQKFFIPFKQQDLKLPFKLYYQLKQTNFYGNEMYLIRNYSDGQWGVLTAIKKNNLDEQKQNIIKKALKMNFNACGLLLKQSQSSFSQFNWFQTKYHIFVSSQYFPENLEENLIRNKGQYTQQQWIDIIKYLTKYFAHILKSMVQQNVQFFKKMKLKDIILNSLDGYPKLNVLQNVINCIDFGQRRRSVIQNGKRISEKIYDKFYQETFVNLVESLREYVGKGKKDEMMGGIVEESNCVKFIDGIMELAKSQQFSFDDILKHQILNQMSMTTNLVLKKHKNPFSVDYQTKFKNIIDQANALKSSSLNSSLKENNTLIISQLKDQIQRTFNLQTIRRNQQRNQNKSLLQIINTTINGIDISKQNIFNITQFKKQQQRKYQLKNKQKQYVQQIINELNQNQNFIKTTKENNLASIEFYLKKSDQKIKKKMIGKIETKYRKFFQRKEGLGEDYSWKEYVERNNQMGQGRDKKGKGTSFQQQASSMTGSINSSALGPLFDNLPAENKDQLSLSHNTYILPHTKTNKFALRKAHSTIKMNLSSIYQVQQQINSKRTDRAKQQQKQRLSAPKQLTMLFRNKKQKHTSPLKKSASNKLQQLFVNSRDYPRDQKVELKKKQYGIYLQQAQKQYNKIKVYRKKQNQ